MQFSTEQIQKIATLARLTLTPVEIKQYQGDMATILNYVSQLDEVDTSQVAPLVHAIDLSNVFREDVLQPSLNRTEALQNAPNTDGKFFLVPQIIDGDH